MRIKYLWEILPLPAKIRLFWDRITLTRTTSVYFGFSVLHCLVQVIFQAQAFHDNILAADSLASIIMKSNSTGLHGFYVFRNDLRLCDHAPRSFSTSSCQVIWNGMVGNNTVAQMPALSTNSTADSPLATSSGTPTIATEQSSILTSKSNSKFAAAGTENAKKRNQNQNEQVLSERRIFQRTIEAVEVNGTVQVVVDGLGWNQQSATLNEECLWTLGWPVQILRNTEREDLTFILFQIWVLGMSIVAILNESVPHIIATLLTHLVATAWAGFQIFSTFQFRSDFVKVTTNGSCHPINFLPTYWQSRSASEITSLTLNAVALLVSALLSWNLARSFGWQTFKRVGASPTISRIYKIVLILSIVIQLSLFFIVTSVALWLDQLWNGAIGHLASSPLYRPFLTITLILLPIWLAFGWYSVRRERKIEMFMFLLLCLAYLTGWGAMFDSYTFRWTYMTWTFFGVMTTASVLLTMLTLILGAVCLSNFGKGLPQYLMAQEALLEGFEQIVVSDPEKVMFPSENKPVISAPLGSEIHVVSFPRMSTRNAPSRIAQPMRALSQRSPQPPSAAITRTASQRTFYPLLHRPLHRPQTSVDSFASSELTCDDKQPAIVGQ